jgi:hypothetical protein
LRSVLTVLLAGVAVFDIANGILVLTGVWAPPVNYRGTLFTDAPLGAQGIGPGLTPSTLLPPFVQSLLTPRLFERRLLGRGNARVGESVQPVRGKAGTGIALEVSIPQQFIDQCTALAPSRVQAYADRR